MKSEAKMVVSYWFISLLTWGPKAFIYNFISLLSLCYLNRSFLFELVPRSLRS